MKPRARLKILAAAGTWIILAHGWLTAAPQFQAEDCVAAVVDARIITAFDMKVVKRFGLSARPAKDQTWRAVLEALISQKIVIDFSQPQAAIDQAEVEAAEKEIALKMGPGEFRKALDEFGMEASDLSPFLEEMLICRKFFKAQFSPNASLTLKEIENYYEDVYVPSQKEAGVEPLSMIQALDRIEAEIREEKKEKQIEAWIETLKTRAELLINKDCFQ